MTLEKVKMLCDGIFDLYCDFENSDYSPEEVEKCEILWKYLNVSAGEESCRNNTEGQVELEKLIENGLDEKEVEYIKVYEKAVYEAYELVGDTKKFKDYCYYSMLNEELERINDDFLK